jgi:phosphatidylinositol alpha-1,6-mannosyltransferase
MARVLFVSKPIAPPWNDSSKNLARDVAQGLQRHTPVVLTDGRGAWAPANGIVEPLYADRGSFTPALGAQSRVLARLLVGPGVDVWHFFFAPNPRASLAAKVCRAARRARTLQTVCSRPRRMERARQLLFADITVVLSRATFEDLRSVGVPAHRLAHVPPAVPPLEPATTSERRAAREAHGVPSEAPVVLYPGDLELGDGAPRALEGFARMRRDAVLVMACRPKTVGAKEAERRLRARARELGIEQRVMWIGETPRIHALVGAADVVVLPSSDLYAKMDLPLVLLEAMWLARPVVVASDGPAAELADDGAVRTVSRHADDLASTMDSLCGSEGTRLGAHARESAEARFRPERMAAAYERLYDRLLEEHA